MLEIPDIYRRLCKVLGKAKEGRGGAGKRLNEMRQLEARISELRDQVRTLNLSGMEKEHRAKSRELRKMEERLEKQKSIHQQRDFNRAMRITGLGLRVEEVVRFGTVSSLLALILALCLSLALGLGFGLDPYMVILLAAGAAVSVPLLVFMFIVNYPERLAKEMELEANGSAPEIVNYLIMSMELSPSLDNALKFAAENAQGPMAREMRALLWKIETRQYSSTEGALADYARELEGVNEELRSAIYNILGAAKEKEKESMRASLNRASDTVLTGTRQRVEEFSSSLSTPATILFALGILLPMIIGTMLPMISLGGFGPPDDSTQPRDWRAAFWTGVLLMNIVFPGIALFYSRTILSKRPGIHTFSLERPADIRQRLFFFILGILLTVSLAWAVASGTSFWGLEAALGSLILLSGSGLAMGYLIDTGSRDKKRIRDLEKLEAQLPDILFQLGSRLSEGVALERALEEAAASMTGTEAGDFLASIMGRLRRSGMGLEEMLFSPDSGMLVHHPSAKVRAALRLVVEAAGKNPETAGGVLISTSNHMRELAKADRDMRTKLSTTIDSMKNTALLFAPVIMGVTVGLYRLLSSTFGEMNGSRSMPVHYFTMIMGMYLLMTVAIMISFCSGIEKGKGRWRHDVAVALPVSAIIYSVTALGALLAFG